MSDAAFFANNNNNGFYFTAVGMTNTTYIVMFHNSTILVADYFGYGVLNAALVTVPSTLPSSTAAPTVSAAVTLPDSAVIYSMAATMLDSDTAVLAYTDANRNYGITGQIIQLATVNASTHISE